MRRLLLLYFISLAFVSTFAQTLPTEKVFIASDRLSYNVGDTIMVKGWLVRSDNEVSQSPYSQYVYLELIDSADSIVCRQKLGIDDKGLFSTSIVSGGIVQNGFYYLRAFSKYMCNFESATIPSFPIEIIGRDFSEYTPNAAIGCRFFPEGGRLVSGGMQNLSVYLSDHKGRPLKTDFYITDDSGSVIMNSSTTPSGWQIFGFTPEFDRHYYLNVGAGKDISSFLLPAPDNSLPVLNVSQGKGKLQYRIRGVIPKDAKLYAYNQSSGLMIIPLSSTGLIDLEGTNDVLISLMLCDKDNQILSECHIWNGTIAESHTAESVQEIVRYIPENEWNNSVCSGFVPVAETITNFESDLESEEFFPHNYILETSAERMIDIKGWLCSARFSRLNIAKVMDSGWKAKYQPEYHNVIQGKIMSEDKSWTLRKGSVVAYQSSNAATYTTEIAKDGTFRLPIGDYALGERFFVSALDKKNNSGLYHYEFSGDTIPVLRGINKKLFSHNNTDTHSTQHNTKHSLFGVNDLPEVYISAKVRKDYDYEEKSYYGHTFLTEEEMGKHNYQSFQNMVYHFSQYMRLQMGGDPEQNDSESTSESASNSAWHLFPAARTSVLSGKSEIKIFLDGNPISADEAMYLNMDDIATVEFLNPARAIIHPFCIEGCLELTTKKYKGTKVRSKGIYYSPNIGIANYGIPTDFNTPLPSAPGRYIKITDSITPTGIKSKGEIIHIQ